MAAGTQAPSETDVDFVLAARDGDLDDVLAALDGGSVSIDARDKFGKTALMAASGNNHMEVVNLLVERRASVSAANESGNTALHWASLVGHKDVCAALLAAKADANAENGFKRRPFDEALGREFHEVCELLCAHTDFTKDGADGPSGKSSQDGAGDDGADDAEDAQVSDAEKDDEEEGDDIGPDERLRLASQNKGEGNDRFKAQKFDEAIQSYRKAIAYVARPKAVRNFTPEAAVEAKKIKLSCHLNSALCHIKGADTALAGGGMSAAQPFYTKGRAACDEVLRLDGANVKGLYRRALCSEKLGDFDAAMTDVKKGLEHQEDDVDLKKSLERLAKLQKRQSDADKKVYGKMFG